MTKDDITKLAREAGFEGMTDHPAVLLFANLVAAHKTDVALAEAYRCGYTDGMKAAAVICENLPVQQDRDVRDECAAAIRDGSRGTYLLHEFAELFGYAEQRPWVELTEQDMPSGEDPIFDHQYFIAGMVYASKVLKEKNHG